MKKITKNEVAEARTLLRQYKDGKKHLESRIVTEEEFWKRRHWEQLRGKDEKTRPASGWMFNSICNKHADAMDSYPEIKCLPREQSDEGSAALLTEIIPVIMERNGFEETYSANWWYKLKHGCAAYGVFWDSSAQNGLGDVQVTRIDLLNIFWEPGITDIQKSRNIFIVDLVPTEDLRARYPSAGIKGGCGANAELESYRFDDAVKVDDKTLVVDWYYKKTDKNGKTALHYCKFAEDAVLFASENEKAYESRGWYDDGKYPIDFDVLYPEEGTPVGFGVVSVCKDAQLSIDELDGAILKTAVMAATPRFFAKESCGINENEFLDWTKPLVHTASDVDDRVVKQINLNPMSGFIANFRQNKIDEMKETSSNRDFSQGSTASGVTSGAAIATLQEAGNKTSRDMINASYRCYARIAEKIIDRMRQFYDERRCFRITGEAGAQTKYVSFGNDALKPQSMGNVGGEELFREPVFDIKIRAQKHNPFSTLSQNETAINLYNAGFFNPQNAQAAEAAIRMMDFEGKKDVEEYILQGQTLYNQLTALQQQNAQLQQMLTGIRTQPQTAVQPGGGASAAPTEKQKTAAEKLAKAATDTGVIKNS